MFGRLSQRILMTMATAMVMSVAIWAQGAIDQKVSFYLDGKVGNELIKKRTYTVSVPDGEQGTIEIKVGKKVVTTPFTKRQNSAEADADKMTYRDNGDGTRTIATITPRGRKFTLLLETPSGVAER
jgi:hypothetical protein